MKTKITTLFIALIAFLALSSCSDENTSDLQLNGSCSVENIVLDNYKGIVDQASRTITVRVPETYDVTNMKVTTLKLSASATSNIKEGDKLNMLTAQQLSIKNGDVFLNWTIKVLRDEAKITSFKINGTMVSSMRHIRSSLSMYLIHLTSILLHQQLD